MNCNEFDVLIDEMLSGLLHPDASQHMQRCERCTSHWRARLQVQQGLRQLAVSAPYGPSAATDRAVMEAFRHLQQSSQRGSLTPESARVLSFPGQRRRSWNPRTLWSGAAAAAVLVAVLGSSVRLWRSTPVVNSPIAQSASKGLNGAEPVNAAGLGAVPSPAVRQLAGNTVRRVMHRVAEAAEEAQRIPPAPPVALAAARVLPHPAMMGAGQGYDSMPNTAVPASAVPMRLASAQVKTTQSASDTWPGYSNLMYCDPVVCSGPMQVIHIKVPVGEVKPSLGQSVGNAFVNAEVVVGPDGVARAIRLAN